MRVTLSVLPGYLLKCELLMSFGKARVGLKQEGKEGRRPLYRQIRAASFRFRWKCHDENSHLGRSSPRMIPHISCRCVQLCTCTSLEVSPKVTTSQHAVFNLFISVPPRNLRIEPQKDTAVEGEETELNCTSMASRPATRIRWFKGSKEISGRTAPQDVLHGVLLGDAG